CMEIGTSCISSVRRCAVTMTSVIPSLVDSLVPAACSCAGAATEAPPRMAATAYEIFDFIRCLPQNRYYCRAGLPVVSRLDMTTRPCDLIYTSGRSYAPARAHVIGYRGADWL